MNAASPETIYTTLLEEHREKHAHLTKSNVFFSAARFGVFIAMAGFAAGALSASPVLWWPVAALLLLFISLVVMHERLREEISFTETSVLACEQELEALHLNYEPFGTGSEFDDQAHPFVSDLDIFGPQSIFSAVNRTETALGRKMLGSWLCEPLRDPAEIKLRQDSIREIAGKPEWRLRLRIYGMMAGEGKNDPESLNQWLKTKPVFDSVFYRIAGLLVPFVSFVIAGLVVSGLMPLQFFLFYLLIPLAITGSRTRVINRRHALVSKKVDLLNKVALRFSMLEQEDFRTAGTQRLAAGLCCDSGPASRHIHALGRITASLDTRLNLLAGFLLNIFLLWDIRQMRRLEAWQKAHRENLQVWYACLAEAEVLASFGAFAFCNPGFIYPEIITDSYVLEATEAGHPLIPAENRVTNDIVLKHRGHFTVITGANMAGKSTYLRTIGVNMVLALAGAPVCATAFRCYPAVVFTSLRTADSLSSSKSYFYAELLRLKDLIDRLGRGEELIVLLDEILKGTNSTDKQAGSKALLTQLIGLGTAGFIATHDLELGKLEELFPGSVSNQCFEAGISGDELHFDYRLKPGIARNLNATFLMQRMGITI